MLLLMMMVLVVILMFALVLGFALWRLCAVLLLYRLIKDKCPLCCATDHLCTLQLLREVLRVTAVV